MAVIISLLTVTKMLYQIQYINHDNWNVNCTVKIKTITYFITTKNIFLLV